MVTAVAQPDAVDKPIARRRGLSIRTSKTLFASKLARAIGLAKQRMSAPLKHRVTALAEFAGPYYGEGVPDGKQRPFSTLYAFVTVLMPSLATGRIAVQSNTRDQELRAPGREIALAVEKVIEDTRLTSELTGVIMDALCGFGILRVSLEASPTGRVDFADWRQDPGLPFGERISPDAYILGPGKSKESAPFEGDIYRMDREDAYNTPGMNHDALDRLSLFTDTRRRGAETMTPGEADHDELFPQFELADMWLPAERVVVTVSPRAESAAGLIREVDGADFQEGGPYNLLGYDPVPDNALPMGPALHMLDLHFILNRVGRKYMRRIDNLKDILTVTDPETGKVREANDGDVITVADANSAKVQSFGGNVAELASAVALLQDQQNRNGPNPEILGGMDTDAPTYGQDRLKYETASRRVSRMQGTTALFVTQAIRQYAWYMWNDQSRIFPGFEEQGGDVMRRESLPADRRAQGWTELGLALNAYASGTATPEEEYQAYAEMFERFVVPMLPMLAAQGITVVPQAVIRKLGSRRGLKELDEWFGIGLAASVQAGQAGAPGRNANGNTSRQGSARQVPGPAPTAQ